MAYGQHKTFLSLRDIFENHLKKWFEFTHEKCII